MWGETQLTNFRVKAKGAGVRTTLLRDKITSRCNCSFIELFHPVGPEQVGARSSRLSINLGNIICPTMVIPRSPLHSTHVSGQSLFQQPLHASSLPQLMLQIFPKSLKGPQTPNEQQPVCLVALARCPNPSPIGGMSKLPCNYHQVTPSLA